MFPTPKFFRGFPFKPELLLLLSTSLKWLQKSDISFLIYACQRLIYMVIINGVSTPVEFQLTPLPPSAQVTQPMMQGWPNPMELRSMDSFIQILCIFQKCERKVPPPSPLSNEISPFTSHKGMRKIFLFLVGKGWFFITEERWWRNFSLTILEST